MRIRGFRFRTMRHVERSSALLWARHLMPALGTRTALMDRGRAMDPPILPIPRRRERRSLVFPVLPEPVQVMKDL